MAPPYAFMVSAMKLSSKTVLSIVPVWRAIAPPYPVCIGSPLLTKSQNIFYILPQNFACTKQIRGIVMFLAYFLLWRWFIPWAGLFLVFGIQSINIVRVKYTVGNYSIIRGYRSSNTIIQSKIYCMVLIMMMMVWW